MISGATFYNCPKLEDLDPNQPILVAQEFNVGDEYYKGYWEVMTPKKLLRHFRWAENDTRRWPYEGYDGNNTYHFYSADDYIGTYSWKVLTPEQATALRETIGTYWGDGQWMEFEGEYEEAEADGKED